jgi:hypothetical protein
VSGITANSGTLYASGSGSAIEIASGAVVNGGTTEVGDGTVEIAEENVSFLSNGIIAAGGADGSLASPTSDSQPPLLTHPHA